MECHLCEGTGMWGGPGQEVFLCLVTVAHLCTKQIKNNQNK